MCMSLEMTFKEMLDFNQVRSNILCSSFLSSHYPLYLLANTIILNFCSLRVPMNSERFLSILQGFHHQDIGSSVAAMSSACSVMHLVQ